MADREKSLSEPTLRAAAIAAYNTGDGNAVTNIAKGLAPEASTTGGDYSTDVQRRAGVLIAQFVDQGGRSEVT